METITMTPREWALVPNNPRQRNTEERVKRARHLFARNEDHRVVKMAIMPEGNRVKIDGHTRALFWRLHPELAPESVLVVVFRCTDIGEALDLYDACDSAAALETSTDKVYGAFRELEFKPGSTFLQVGRIAAALRLAWTIEMHASATQAQISIHGMVRHWLPELTFLDGLEVQSAYFNTSVLAASLLTLRRHKAVKQDDGNEFRHLAAGAPHFADGNALGTQNRAVEFSDGNDFRPKIPRGRGRPTERAELVREFWERYARNDGTKHGHELDAVEALRRIIEQDRHKHHLKSTVVYATGRAVACVERYLLKRTYKVGDGGSPKVNGMDLTRYFPPAAASPVPPAPQPRAAELAL